MEQPQIINLCITLGAGIIIGLIIGWALWHGAGAEATTCPMP